jgi:hypothetical protein
VNARAGERRPTEAGPGERRPAEWRPEGAEAGGGRVISPSHLHDCEELAINPPCGPLFGGVAHIGVPLGGFPIGFRAQSHQAPSP